jgi:hypothetical protein
VSCGSSLPPPRASDVPVSVIIFYSLDFGPPIYLGSICGYLLVTGQSGARPSVYASCLLIILDPLQLIVFPLGGFAFGPLSILFLSFQLFPPDWPLISL